MKDRIETKAVATLTIELPAFMGWSDDTTVKQIFKQATDKALTEVRKAFLKTDINIVDGPHIRLMNTIDK